MVGTELQCGKMERVLEVDVAMAAHYESVLTASELYTSKR